MEGAEAIIDNSIPNNDGKKLYLAENNYEQVKREKKEKSSKFAKLLKLFQIENVHINGI